LINVRARAIAEGARSSLFFLPSIYVVSAIVLAELLLTLDSVVDSSQLPALLRTTVDSARALLGTIAGALITVAALVTSIVVVALQVASSQYSPSVSRTLFRSRFQQSVMGFMVGTFAYCLVVLNSVRSPLLSNGEDTISGFSTTGALVLSIIAALAMLAYVDHTAHSMQISEIIRRVTAETIDAIDKLPPHATAAPTPSLEGVKEPDQHIDIYAVRARRGGWVQQASSEALLAAVPAKTTIWLDTRVGRFVPRGGLLCRVQPRPDNVALVDNQIIGAIYLGTVRTMQEDISFGILQLADVALRALSPGVNDPTTAYEVIAHLGDVLSALQAHDLPPTVAGDSEGRRIVRPYELSHVDLINRAFDQIRIAGASQPAIVITLLNTFGALLEPVMNLTSVCARMEHEYHTHPLSLRCQ
jgi:uncharacterized membrane protein